MSRHNYVALVLDYYKDIGSFYVLNKKERLQRWHAHQQAVHNAVNYLKTLPEVDKEHIGLVGYSQGAMLALSVASDIPKVSAVVDYYGVSPAQKDFLNKVGMEKLENVTTEDYLDTLPPLLILYGNKDSGLIIDESKMLYDELKRRGKEVQLQVYQGESHGFDNPDARNRVLIHLDRYLKGRLAGKVDETVDIEISKREPWTGVWKVESNSEGGGIWAMKQEGNVVTSTNKSDYEFKGQIIGNQLKGRVKVFTGTYYPIVFEQQPGSLTFTGTMDYIGRTFHLKGKRIE